LIILSVGGGDIKKNISVNLIEAIKLAKKRKSKVLSIVGKPDGYAAKNSDLSIVIPVQDKKLLTAFSEIYQAVIWHLVVSHPELKEKQTKWESVSEKK
jgi:D-sedoheptulose 7-phosphate isomerase